MNATQQKAVLETLIEQQRRTQNEAPAIGAQVAFIGGDGAHSMNMERWIEYREKENQQTLAALESTLTSEQLEHIRQSFESEIAMTRASSKLQRAQGNDEATIMSTHSTVGFTSFEAAAESEAPR